ncbi:nucleoporin FG repeat region [Ceratobasidium sp. AG-Ba]|nr:nucleoporin FG repeat region [Ceratobasidium sp. AG-Ba]
MFSFSSAPKPATTTTAATPSPFGGSLFGQSNTTQAQTPAATGGLFGAQNTQTTNPPATGGLFGAQPATNAANTTASGGLFGQPASTTTGTAGATGTTGGLFGTQPAPGATATGTTTGGLFGAQPATQPSTTATTGGLFGQTQTQPQQAQPSFSFGGATTTAAPAQQPAQPAGPFTRTTKFNDLPDSQKKIFEELESFIQGRVQISVELKTQKLGEEIAKENVVLDELTKSLAAASSALTGDRLAADDQRNKTEQNLQDALSATRIIDGFSRPQQMGSYLTSYANFPLEFFTRQTEEIKERVQRYKSTMEQIERKLNAALESHTPQPAQPSPQAIANALKAQHQSFMALAARTAEIDSAVQRLKTAYTARWRAQTGSARDPFAPGNGKEDEVLDALMGMSVAGR